MLGTGLKLRWAVVATVALALVATATTSCNVTADPHSASTSGSADDWDQDDAGLDGEETIFGTMEAGGNGNGNGPKGCTEEALWCPSLGQALSRDPKNKCKFPRCP